MRSTTKNRMMAFAMATFALFLICIGTARAASVLVSNLMEPSGVGSVGFNDIIIEAGSFTTNQQSAILEGASAQLGVGQGTTLFAQIHEDKNNAPGALIEELGTVTLTQTGNQTVTFNASGTKPLHAATTYWLVIGTTGDGAGWDVTESMNSFSPFGWTIDQRTQSNDGGITWLPPRSDDFLKFSISGTKSFIGTSVNCLGDINGDGITDIAVVLPDGSIRVRDISGALITGLTPYNNLQITDVEMMQDINSNGAPELALFRNSSANVFVHDSLTGRVLSSVNFNPTLTPLDLELVDDQTSNGIPELANLGQGSVKVEVKDALTAGLINTVSFSNYVNPRDLEIYPDLNGNGSPELAVLGDNKDPAKGDKIEVRDLTSGSIVQNIWLGKGWQVLQQELLADYNGNGAEEVAVLRVRNNDDAVNVMVRDTKTRQRLGSIGFDRNYPPTQLLTIRDVNGNGTDEVVVFGQRINGGNQKAQIKDSKTKALIKAVFFDKNFAGQDIAKCADINGNGAEELVLLGKRANDGKLKATVKDAKTGELIGVFKF